MKFLGVPRKISGKNERYQGKTTITIYKPIYGNPEAERAILEFGAFSWVWRFIASVNNGVNRRAS